MAMALTLALPRFIVLQSNVKQNDFMGYIHEKGDDYYGYLAFVETKAESPYAKFEVEPSDIDGLVHIRSFQNNKYLVRTKNRSITGREEEENWITATAKKPEKDQSKESCTLFKPIIVDAATKTFRIMHVQSGCYLCLWALPKSSYVLANYKVYDHQNLDIFKIIDWDSLVILPRYLAFKGDNGHYLRLIEHSYLQFSADDIGDSNATFENFTISDGALRMKSTSNNKFWRRSPNWIWSDSDDTSNNNMDTLFRPFKVDYHTIGLLNLGNNQFCKRLTLNGITNCLNAYVSSITKEAKLLVEEPILSRTIDDVKYDLEDSRIYDEKVVIVCSNSTTNNTQQAITLELKILFPNSRISTWNNNYSLTLGTNTSMEFSVPIILDGTVNISGEVQSGVKWGKTITTTAELEIIHKVVVPPMTKVTVNLTAINGTCHVPFTYMQKDTLNSGTTFTTKLFGFYTGSNYYNSNLETIEEPIKM